MLRFIQKSPSDSVSAETAIPEPSTNAEPLTSPETAIQEPIQQKAEPVDPAMWLSVKTNTFRMEMVHRGSFKVQANYIYPRSSKGAFHGGLWYRIMPNWEQLNRSWLSYSQQCNVFVFVFCFFLKAFFHTRYQTDERGCQRLEKHHCHSAKTWVQSRTCKFNDKVERAGVKIENGANN